jgi:uncharacterized membrane protein
MEFLVLLLILLVASLPIMAIVALVRTGKLSQLIKENTNDYLDKLSDLRREVTQLRSELAQLSRRVGEQAIQSPVVPVSGIIKQTQASEAAATHVISQKVEHVEPQKVPPPPPFDFQAKTVAPSPVYFKQSGAVAETPKPIPPPEKPLATPPPVAPSQSETKTAPPPLTPHVATPAEPQFTFVAPPLVESQYRQSPIFQQEEKPRRSLASRLRSTLPLEELLGMNLFAKIGIILLVLGFALLGRVALVAMGPAARVALISAVALTLLGTGIWLETKDRYRLIGRTGIGGGWALLFFTTFAMYHIAAMTVMTSLTLNCVLMLIVAIAMVVHTLRYRSQLVTGLAFLLAFSTVALGQDTVYALVAGTILAGGIVAIALRMGWFELEIFGILASFGNHFYWLYKLYPTGVAGHAFPKFWPSVSILILYWLIYRISYIARKIESPYQEKLSTVAALLNTVLLLLVMKFQSTRPELAFYALLALGAMEFSFGQTPQCRRRRAPFVLLTVLGTLLIFAAIPFKFTGNNIALFWMIAAEALLIAGIAQSEKLFRRLGLLAGIVTGALVIYEAAGIFEFRQHSDLPRIQDGVMLLICAGLFYINAQFIRRKWQQHFESFDNLLLTVQSYIGGVTAFLGIWCILTGEWTAIGWAALLLGFVVGKRYLDDNHLMVQGWAMTAVVLFQSIEVNAHLDNQYPHHMAARLLTLPVLGLVFYLCARLLSGVDDLRNHLRTVTLWAGTSLLALLVYTEVAPPWVALIWVAGAVTLSLVARWTRLVDLAYQEHALAIAAVVQLILVNMNAQNAWERYVPLIGTAVAFYSISRFCTLKDAIYQRPAAWLHTCTATALLAALAWQESSQLWLSVIWVVFALALAIVDRIFDVEELPYQSHILAFMALVQALTLNLFTIEKWHSIDVRLITVSILVAVFYALARWARLPRALSYMNARHIYTWIASGLAAWLIWSELQPIAVAVGLATFGLLLFEFGEYFKQRQIRIQGYLALAGAFVRIFFVNLTAQSLAGDLISPRIYSVAPLAFIYFYIWMRLQPDESKTAITSIKISDILAYFGTASIAALLYFQTPSEWIVVAWAVMVLPLLAISLLLKKSIFTEQACLLVVWIVGRGFGHNIYGSSYFVANGWRGNFMILSLVAAILLAALPVAFRLRKRYADIATTPWLTRAWLFKFPEQVLFFAPVLLVSFMIAVKMNPGMITLSWGIEGVVVILLGLAASTRSYRLTGLALLLLCVGKIIVLDAWRLQERDRYITFIVLGAALTLVSMLYTKFREVVSRLL